MAIYTIMIKNRALGKIEVIKDTINRVKLSKWFYSVYSSPEKFLRNSVKEDARTVLDMIILDSIILNCDRHASNYGFYLTIIQVNT